MLFYISVLIPVLLIVWKLTDHHRSYELERQDKSEAEGRYTKQEYAELMHILAELNEADPNGYAATVENFEQLGSPPESILEIGFGLGHFSILLAHRYPNATVLGIDAHQYSVDSANEFLRSLSLPPRNVHFEHRSQVQLNEPDKSVDVITTTFVNHHIFPDDQFVDFIQRVAKVGKKAFIFNDYHRSRKCIATNDAMLLGVQYIGMDNLVAISQYLPEKVRKTATGFQHVFTSARQNNAGVMGLFADGGRLSMRRSFSIEEYHALFAAAGYPADALRCRQLDQWYELLESTCRVVCTADLTWAVEKAAAAGGGGGSSSRGDSGSSP
jgi:ubiquinone/menaquinone biosynthesis C-methylase UbiE